MENNSDRMGFALIALSVVAFVLFAVNGTLQPTVKGFFNGFKDWQTQTFAGINESNKQDVTHTAYSWSSDGTDRFTTTKPNLNLINGTDATTRSSGFYTIFDSVKDGYGEVTLTSTDKSYDARYNRSAYVTAARNYVPGDKYTLSYDIMFTDWNMPSDVMNFDFGFGQRYNTSATKPEAIGSWRGIFWSGLNNDSNEKVNNWYHIVRTFDGPDKADATVGDEGSLIFKAESATQSVIKTTFRMKNVKLEKGSVATAWMPSASEVKPSDQPKYIGTYTDKNDSASQDPSKYTWKLNPEYHE